MHELLSRFHRGINQKCAYRLYSQANLAVRRRRKGHRPNNARAPLVEATRINQARSMDFVRDSTDSKEVEEQAREVDNPDIFF